MILYTSDINKNEFCSKKIGFSYLCIALICALFGAIYEVFSYGVYSFFMIYAFAFPLIGGSLYFFALDLFGKRVPGRLSLNLYNSGIATLTIGCILEGILEIYGTTNSLTSVYWFVGILFVLVGILFYIVELYFKK